MIKKIVEAVTVICAIPLLASAYVIAHQRDSLKQEAVDRGFAEWKIIEGTSKREFRWKDQ